MKIVVAKLVTFPRINGVIEKENAKVIRPRVVVSEAFIETFNAENETQAYIVDKEATTERNKGIAAENEPVEEVKPIKK